MPKTIFLEQFQFQAMWEWKNIHGVSWKTKLAYAWADGNYHGYKRSHILQQIRNQHGPTWLDQFSFKNVVIAPQPDAPCGMCGHRAEEHRCEGGWGACQNGAGCGGKCPCGQFESHESH